MRRNVRFATEVAMSNEIVGHSPGPSVRPKPPGRAPLEARQPLPTIEVVTGEGVAAGETPKAGVEVEEAEAVEVQGL